MTPTPVLRYIQRKHQMHPFYRDSQTGGPAYQTYHVLQQWWEWPDSFDVVAGRPVGEWRDVPMEEEQT